MTRAELLDKIAADPELIEFARRAIEDAVITRRNSAYSEQRGNGLVCRNADGSPGWDVIRMGPDEAMRIGLRAIAKRMIETEIG